MTARARITATDLAQAAALVKAEGVTVTIATANGKSVTIAPVDASPLQAQASPVRNRAGGNSCDEAFGGRS